MQESDIGFIGAGNMARSLIGGLVSHGHSGAHLWAADPDPAQRDRAKGLGAAHTSASNEDLARRCDVLVIAVKPQMAREVLTALSGAVGKRGPLVISIAAGIPLHAIESWLEGEPRVVRCMPNTPALVAEGMTGMFANTRTTDTDRTLAEAIMGAVGRCLWLPEESQLDAVTALSGSGPAYFFYLFEAMIEAGRELGLAADHARVLALQTALGASRMALQSEVTPEVLRAQVTSPGGTTERALGVLRDGGFSNLVKTAIKVADERAEELARDFGSL